MAIESPVHISRFTAYLAGKFDKFPEWQTRQFAPVSVAGWPWMSVNRRCQRFVRAGMTLLDAGCLCPTCVPSAPVFSIALRRAHTIKVAYLLVRGEAGHHGSCPGTDARFVVDRQRWPRLSLLSLSFAIPPHDRETNLATSCRQLRVANPHVPSLSMSA